jgi:hypothetical protein
MVAYFFGGHNTQTGPEKCKRTRNFSGLESGLVPKIRPNFIAKE